MLHTFQRDSGQLVLLITELLRLFVPFVENVRYILELNLLKGTHALNKSNAKLKLNHTLSNLSAL
jgi:hypothetical protein